MIITKKSVTRILFKENHEKPFLLGLDQRETVATLDSPALFLLLNNKPQCQGRRATVSILL